MVIWDTLQKYKQIVRNKAKGRISKQVFQENKARQIFRKTNISYPLIWTHTCANQGVRNVHFSENLTCFLFLKHPCWDLPFCLITDEMLFKIIFLHIANKTLIVVPPFSHWNPYLTQYNLQCSGLTNFNLSSFLFVEEEWQGQPG